ncbi:FIST C-terminal domain-containing protein [Azospirillum sp. YIM B02556]|uniref:histidine kinase n=1 Tax=Azospirillum endophyticum TaxID=2800326 RepID=A0ABS1F1B2_9PROT|nr:FIST N-terminal domain-containing protein [Azospirillum endophyticum]MBK1837209.1 FIST C-terminal domain-containing protein [Azospirillum endophyticum]
MPSAIGCSNAFIRTLAVDAADIEALPALLAFEDDPPAFVLGFVSPELPFPEIAGRLRSVLDPGSRLVLVSTAGELCSGVPGGLYHPGERQDGIVLQAFSRVLFGDVSIHSVPLHSEDIRAGTIRLTHEQRIDALRRELETIDPVFPLDCHDTVALLFIDGLSVSESWLMEAVYASGRFPVLFVGGSAGGALDFQETWLYDGERVLDNHAVVIFVRMAPGKRYGVFKSQNFRKAGLSFTILDCDPIRRTVTSVIDPDSLEVTGFIEALCRSLRCDAGELERLLISRTFAVELDSGLFVRSVAGIDRENGRVSFFCDVNAGDELLLLEATDFIEQTRSDFAAFLRDKPEPVGGILNDCVLRRINNGPSLTGMTVFDDIPVAGFSTFGEILGINVNQTLSAIFFFSDDREGEMSGLGGFRDDYVARFPIHYGHFQNFFHRARNTRLRMLNRMRQSLIRNLVGRTDAAVTLYGRFKQIGAYTEEIGTQVSDPLGSAVEDLLDAVRQVTEEREAVAEVLSLREAELLLAEERRSAAVARMTLEAQLQEAQKLEALGCMAGGLAHEINNMLQPIIGLTELVMEDLPLDGPAQRNLGKVIEAAQRAKRITQQVLTFSHSDRSGAGPLHLGSALRNVAEMVDVLVSRNVELVWRIAVKPILVRADETQMAQILINLIRNAADAIGPAEGAIEVTLDSVQLDEATEGAWPHPAGPYAALTVRDSGCGMDAATLARIFDPFFTTKPVGQGTGLGLPVVHGIVAGWKGHIHADSSVGQGTAMQILLPIIAAEDDHTVFPVP